MSAVFGVVVADLNGDGAEDLFLAQNFFAQRSEEARSDAGRGLLLWGDGHGGFVPVAGALSGLKIYGEQRGAATADFDEDGRADLVVAQNGGATKLFRNSSAKQGLRVRLRGRSGNPDAIGAVLRAVSIDGTGPARELHGGGGYGSQDGLVTVLSLPSPITEVWLRWPGGAVSKHAVAPGAREIVVSQPAR